MNGVAVTSTVTAVFNEAVVSSTVTGSTFTLTQGGSSVAAMVTLSLDGLTATLTPTAPLAYNTTYIATLTTGITSTLGASLAANDVWTFTTATAPVPQVTVVSPLTGAPMRQLPPPLRQRSISDGFIDHHCLDLHPDWAGKHALCRAPSITTPVLRSRHLLLRRISPITLRTLRQSQPAVKSSGEVALAAPYTWSFTTRRRRSQLSRPPYRQTALPV